MTVRDVPWMNADAGQPDYSAADFRLVGSALAGHTGTTRLLGARSGVVPGVDSALQVTHDGLTPGEVTVGVGQAWIDADLSLGAYLVTVEVAETFPVPAAGAVTRTDRVVARARDAEVDPTVGTDRSGAVEYLAGDSGTGNPEPVPDHALLLAEVTVPVSSTPSVEDSRTYQARTDSAGRPVADQAEQDGIVTPYVGMALYRRDTGDVQVWDGTEWQQFTRVLPYARAIKTGQQSIPNATGTLVDLDITDTESVAGFVDAPNDQLVVPVTGRYDISAQVRFAANATGARTAHIFVNSQLVAGNGTSPSSAGGGEAGHFVSVHVARLALNASDSIQLHTFQTSGGALDTSSAAADTWIEARQVPQ